MISKFHDGRDWFFEKRFGLFLHWGLYAIPAYHEQVLWRKMEPEGVPIAEYEKLIHEFDPVKYNPDEWLDYAETAGIDHMCITTKHHDGFCLWNTQYTNYNIMNTPYGKDVIAMFVDACHKRGMPLLLYYSCVDWNNRNYPNYGGDHELRAEYVGQAEQQNMHAYLEYVKNQVTELCTQYGKLHGIWFDLNSSKAYAPEVNALIRKYQPDAVISNRGYSEGDFVTPERKLPESGAFSVPTQGCNSLGVQSWGYKEDEDWYSLRYLISSVDRFLAMGGSFLLNVGPTAEGTFPRQAIDVLKRVGHWYHRVKEAFDGTEPCSHLTENPQVLLTRKADTVYVHLIDHPDSSTVVLRPMDTLPKRAVLLNNGQNIEVTDQNIVYHWKQEKAMRLRNLPVDHFSNEIMVVRLEY